MAEVYQCVLVQDMIGNAGFNVNADSNAPMSSCAFINLLTGKLLLTFDISSFKYGLVDPYASWVRIDVRQVKCPEQATCFLSDCRKLHFAFTPNFLLREPRRRAGMVAGHYNHAHTKSFQAC